jgi:hypothetical protein
MTTKITPFEANYGLQITAYREKTEVESISPNAEEKAKKMKELHARLHQAIRTMNEKMTRQANKKRIAGPTFKEGDKVFLLRKNIKTKRPSRKLDHVRIGPFEIEKQVGPVNFKLRLPEKMRIHPVFHVSLLEPAPHDALLETDIEVEPEHEFEVEQILDKKKINGQWKYLVKWEGYPPEDNTWEPRKNLTDCAEKLELFLQASRSQDHSKDRSRKD